MNAFIGNHIRFIVSWGQVVTGVVFVLGVLALYLVTRRHRFFIPRSVAAWLACLAICVPTTVGGLAFARIGGMKAGAAPILAGLDALQGRPAPALLFRHVADGTTASLADFRGRVVLVNLWATWCAPCRTEMPELDRLQRALAADGLVVLAISDEAPGDITAYLAENPATFVSGYVDAFDWVDMGGERPVTFLVDRDGVVRDSFTGPWDQEFFAREVGKYL